MSAMYITDNTIKPAHDSKVPRRCSASDDAYKLANAVLANAKKDSRDPETLKNAALFTLARDKGKR